MVLLIEYSFLCIIKVGTYFHTFCPKKNQTYHTIFSMHICIMYHTARNREKNPQELTVNLY